MSSAPPPPTNQWEQLNRPRSERSPLPPAPSQPLITDQPSADKKRGGIDPFVLLGIGAVAFVLLAGGFMVLGGFLDSGTPAEDAVPVASTDTAPPTTALPEERASSTTAVEIEETSVPSFNVPPDLTREEAGVFRLYLLIFGRAPDTSGLDYWSGELANGTPLGEMAQQLMSTDEFVAEYGERPSQAELVDLVHLRLYGRPATPEEREFWGGIGVEGIEFLIAFSNSPEAREALGSN